MHHTLVLSALGGCIFLFSCNVSHDPYLKHKVKLEKLSESCSGKSDKFNMNSNTNGERYTFQECLDANSDEKNVIIERRKDTVFIQFKKTGQGTHLYDLTIDINTRPQYNWLVVGENTIAILPSGN
jgi:hypothetical protein